MATGTLEERVRLAIEHARLIDVKYKRRVRAVEPHDYGIKNGSVKLLVYQLFESGPGSARSRSGRGWRLFEQLLARVW